MSKYDDTVLLLFPTQSALIQAVKIALHNDFWFEITPNEGDDEVALMQVEKDVDIELFRHLLDDEEDSPCH